MLRIDKPGIYRGISPADYFADCCPEPSLSQSLIKVILDQSLMHAASQHPRITPVFGADETGEKYDKAKAIGNAAHATMIGRGKDIEVIRGFEDFKKADAKALRDAAFAGGRVPILQKHFDEAADMVRAGWEQLKVHEDRDAFTNGDGEVALIWHEDGIWCRALVDWLHTDLRTVDDFKTSGMSMAPHVIGIRAETAGWHIQASFIERGLDVLDPEGAGRRRFRFIGLEQDAPYGLTVMHMTPQWMTMGDKKTRAAMTLWQQAMRSGKFRGYPSVGVTPDYPGFRESQWLERELSGEFEADPSLIMAG
jgi:hypothetical protein